MSSIKFEIQIMKQTETLIGSYKDLTLDDAIELAETTKLQYNQVIYLCHIQDGVYIRDYIRQFDLKNS